MVRRSVVAGYGSYLPARVLSNEELARKVDTSDEWITERTGITQRHVAADGEMTSHLAVHAGQAALDKAGLSAEAVDMVLVATSTPNETFPATATIVQAELGMQRGLAFDLQAVCAGFVYGLATADNFIKAGQVETVLVIGAETFTRILDWTDRRTCVLFGDGAGAVVLQAGDGDGTVADRGILSSHLFSDGRYHDMLYVDGGPSSTGESGHLRMAGREVFKHAVVKMAEATEAALAANDIQASDVDWFVPHQANRRIIDATTKKLGLDREKVVITVDRHANTSAASIPLALAEAAGDGRIKQGQLVLIEALGGGFAWGASLIRW
ncbi:MAG: beta-ketoacyl-ACP synthase III [Alphaproteobacteria bacterium]